MPNKAAKEAEKILREFALSFPGATEDFPWGERALKVNKKVFVFMSKGGDEFSMSTKLPLSRGEALHGYDFTEPTHYGLGKHGWVSSSFPAGKKIPIPVLKDWIAESYRAVAPKALLKKLDAPAAEPLPKKKAAPKK